MDKEKIRLVREFKQAVAQYEALHDVEYDEEVFGAAMDKMVRRNAKPRTAHFATSEPIHPTVPLS